IPDEAEREISLYIIILGEFRADRKGKRPGLSGKLGIQRLFIEIKSERAARAPYLAAARPLGLRRVLRDRDIDFRRTLRRSLAHPQECGCVGPRCFERASAQSLWLEHLQKLTDAIPLARRQRSLRRDHQQ